MICSSDFTLLVEVNGLLGKGMKISNSVVGTLEVAWYARLKSEI